MPFCSPDKITIPEGRFRDVTLDDPSVIERAQSIKDIGQLQPILVTKDMEVVDGATRLLACRRLERDVWWVDEEEGRLLFGNPKMRRVAEFQANFSRKDFTPIQLAKAIAEVDTIMREIYGSRVASPGAGASAGWTQEDTAKKLGYKSKGSVSTALMVAAALEDIPTLADAKTMSDAARIVKDTAKLEALKELAKRQTFCEDAEIKNPLEFFGAKVILGDCVEKMKGLGTGICNLFITDPPFAEDLDVVIKAKGEVSIHTSSTYRDDPAEVMATLTAVIKEMARVGKPMCQVVMFCSESNWHILRDLFLEEKFSVYERMLLWVKAQQNPFKLYGGRTMNPVVTPASSYEIALYAWRGGATLAQPGCTNVFVYPPLPPNKKFHVAQKPVALLQDIISRFYHPGTNPLLIDPFCGSGSTLIAARRLGIKQYFGYERDPEFRERAVAHLVNTWHNEQRQAAELGDLELDDDDLAVSGQFDGLELQ